MMMKMMKMIRMIRMIRMIMMMIRLMHGPRMQQHSLPACLSLYRVVAASRRAW
jgi:hypothetical protein